MGQIKFTCFSPKSELSQKRLCYPLESSPFIRQSFCRVLDVHSVTTLFYGHIVMLLPHCRKGGRLNIEVNQRHLVYGAN